MKNRMVKIVIVVLLFFALIYSVRIRYQKDINMLLKKACEANDVNAVYAALRKGADPNMSVIRIFEPEKITSTSGLAGIFLPNRNNLVYEEPIIIDQVNPVLVFDPKTGKWVPSKDIYKMKIILKQLINSGANVNTIDQHGTTPLMRSAELNPEIVNFLLDEGAGINIRNKLGKNALIYAVDEWADNEFFDTYVANLEIVKILIQRGIRLNDRDCNGKTALYWAKKTKNRKVIEFLISNGATL